jgi:citrate lyase beta subunit
MLGKGPTLGADMVFIDLERPVSPLEKEAARQGASPPSGSRTGATRCCASVNAWDTP